MTIPIEKATNIVRDYKKNNYNARKTVLENGYSESYANSVATKVIDRAYKTVATEIANSDAPRLSAQAFTLLSDDDIRGYYLDIIKQDKDLSTKLKALIPLLKEKGVMFDNDNPTMKPTLNLTMIKNSGDNMDNNGEMRGGVGQGDSIVSSIEPLPKNEQNSNFTEETSNEDNTPISNDIDTGIEESSPEPKVSQPEQQSIEEAEEILMNLNG